MTMKDLNRRDLLKASGLATAGSAGVALAAQRSGAGRRQREPRDIYELRRYTLEDYQDNIDHDPHVEYPILGEDGTLSLDGVSWGVGIKWQTFHADFGFVLNEYLGSHKFVSLQYQF